MEPLCNVDAMIKVGPYFALADTFRCDGLGVLLTSSFCFANVFLALPLSMAPSKNWSLLSKKVLSIENYSAQALDDKAVDYDSAQALDSFGAFALF